MLQTKVKALDEINFGYNFANTDNSKQEKMRMTNIQKNVTYPTIDRTKLDALKAKIERKYKLVISDHPEKKQLDFDYQNYTFSSKPRSLNYSSLNIPEKKIRSGLINEYIFNNPVLNPIFNRYLRINLITTCCIVLIILVGSGIILNSLYTSFEANNFANAGKEDNSNELSEKQIAYKSWIESQNNGQFSKPEEDLDNDELNNYEEFLIGSNPKSPYSCNTKITDIQNLKNLINPSTCKAINLEDKQEVTRFGQIINIPPTIAENEQSSSSTEKIKEDQSAAQNNDY
jgi:hypothetical protein